MEKFHPPLFWFIFGIKLIILKEIILSIRKILNKMTIMTEKNLLPKNSKSQIILPGLKLLILK